MSPLVFRFCVSEQAFAPLVVHFQIFLTPINLITGPELPGGVDAFECGAAEAVPASPNSFPVDPLADHAINGLPAFFVRTEQGLLRLVLCELALQFSDLVGQRRVLALNVLRESFGLHRLLEEEIVITRDAFTASDGLV